MSNIYVTHFELAAGHKSVDYAFAVLERTRGRVLRDVIAQVAASESTRRRSEEYIRLQRELSRLQRSLLGLKKTTERETALRQIWEVEQKLIGAEVQTEPGKALARKPFHCATCEPTLQQTNSWWSTFGASIASTA